MIERVSRRARSLLPAATGGLLLLAPDDARLLALSGFCGLALLAEALEHTRTVREAAQVGLLFGTLANATALFSVVGLLRSFAHLAWPWALLLSLLLWLVQGALFALAAALSHLVEARGAPRWLALPSSLMLALSLPSIFPWHVAPTQLGFLPFVQMADLGGEALVGFVLTMVACALQALVRSPRRTPMLVLLASLGLPLVYGFVRIEQVRQLRARAETLRVGVVQSNVSTAQKHDEASARDNLQGLLTSTAALEARGAELTIWGETAYPYPLLRSQQHAPTDIRRVLTAQVHGPVLLGLETYLGFDERAHKYNSAWLVRRDNSLGGRVDKTRLLAFGETIPFWDWLPPIRARYASAGFTAGIPGTIEVAGHELGVSICYEDLFASAARATVRLGGRALLNLTNDAWFGDSREPRLHDTLARMRSVELRRDLVRAVNTGISSFSSATGEALVQTDTFVPASFLAEVRLLDEQTLYARFGDWMLPCCLLVLAVLLARAARSRKLSS